MKVDLIQTSFASGEFGPSLFGRTDIAQYANACAIVENFIVKATGSVVSAPGTRYVATVSDSTLRTRIISFVFNRSDAYAIEMGDRYLRFYTNRGQVTANSGTENLSAFGSDLIAHWKMNDNTNSTVVLDAQGTHNGVSSVNTATMSTTGIVSTGFNFADAYSVAVADHANFTRTASTQPMSLMTWVYYEATGADQNIFAKNSGTTATSEYDFRVLNNDILRFKIFDGTNGGSKEWRCNSTITEGWHLVGFTFVGPGTSSGDCVIYIDGEIAATTYIETGTFVAMINTATGIGIGARSDGISNKWKNKIDNMAFFHKRLSASEVASLITTTAYQISTVYTESEVFDVKYTQLNDVIWLAHPSHPPQKLIRTSANSWTIGDAPILGGPFLDDNTPTPTSSGVSASTVSITPSATIGTINLTVSPTTAGLFTVSGSTLGHHGSYWSFGLTTETSSTTGLKETSYVRIDYVTNSYTATATVIKNLRSTNAKTTWAEGAWSAVRGYPSCVILHERRLWFGRTNHEPQKVWGSKVFDYENLLLDEQSDEDGMNLALASNESNEIQWLASGKSLIPGTFGGAFVINSGSTSPITPDNANASEEVGFGADSIQPKKIGNLLYYVQRFGKKLREMFFHFDTDTYKALDATIFAPHILGGGVVDMALQENPASILYCVTTAGTLSLFTREVDHELRAWSRLTTNGTYSSVAIIPSQTSLYDEAWVIVERWVNGAQKRYVEFFEDIDVPERQDHCLYLHSALTYDAYDSTSTSAVTISLSASSGSVTLTSSSAYFNGQMIGKRIRAIDASGTTLGQGQITATASTLSVTLSITTTFNSLSYAAGRWGVSVSSVSGLSHLEAKTVGVLADGLKESLTRTVASGVVTLGSNYWVVSVGLSYDQVIYTLPKEAGNARGTAQGKLQRINDIALKVNRSTQDFKYGTSADNLDDLVLAFTPTVTSLYTGVLPPQGGGIAMRGGYFRGAQIYIKNSNPLPVELLSIIATLDTYEK